MEKSLKILEPCVESHVSDPARRNHKGHVETSASISNRFSLLKMEESPDADPVEVSEVAVAVSIPPKTNASKTDPEIAVSELNDEDEFDDELAFIISVSKDGLHLGARLIFSRFFRGSSSYRRLRE